MCIQKYGDGAKNDFPGDSGLRCGCKCHNIVMLLQGAIHLYRSPYQDSPSALSIPKVFSSHENHFPLMSMKQAEKNYLKDPINASVFLFPQTPALWENFSNAALRSWSEAAESLLPKSPGYHCLPVYLFSNLKVAVGRFILIVLYVWLMLNCG